MNGSFDPALDQTYKELFDANPLPMWVYDIYSLNFLAVNVAAVNQFGYAREKFLQRSVLDLVSIQDRDRFEVCMRKRYPDFTTLEGFHLVRANGSILDVELHWKSLTTPQANLLTINDISERNRAETRLRQAYGELTAFKSAVNAASIVAVTDLRGDIIEANDNFCKISGYSREELLGKNHRLVNSGYHPPEFFKDLWKTIAHGEIWNGEVRNRRKDGTFYWVNTTVSPIIDEKGKPIRYLAIRNDITQRKEGEEKVRHAENNLRSLQDRMSPHFLFNTLSIIHAFLGSNVALADSAILMLADNYRFLIQHSNKETIPFSIEWEFMTNYAHLLLLRHSDTMQVDIRKESDFSGFVIPPLTLQPLIENAYKHGIRDKREGGRITAIARLNGKHAEIEIQDNGVGPGKKDVMAGTLGTVAERLRYCLPGSSLTVAEHPDGGTIARLVLYPRSL
ncbi:MAG: PAS domain S-box protein [Spirochaetia bacterium]|nr:PAS domain S-box protein [Spirochaetia bacterium]